MKIFKYFIMIFISFMLITFIGCSKKDDTNEPETPETIDPGNANALTAAIQIPTGNRINGIMPLPTPSGTSGIPVINGAPTNLLSSNGSTLLLPFSFQSASGLGGVFLQIAGASSYFSIPYSGGSGTIGNFSIPITLPTNVTQGQFQVEFSVFNTAATPLISQRSITTVSVQQLGTGVLQISLSWDTPDTDLDLYVTDPSNAQIYWNNRTSSTGGELDKDDQDGYGPENIFWKDSAPDGVYKVEVDYWDGSAKTNFVVTVSNGLQSRSWQDYFNSDGDPMKLVVTITKSGSNLSFSKIAVVPGIIQ